MTHYRITSLDDAHIAPYRDLKDRRLVKDGRFIVEGEHAVRRLLASQYRVDSVLVTAHRLERIAPVVPSSLPIYVVDDPLIHHIVGFKFHSGVIACGCRGQRLYGEELLATAISTSAAGKPLTLAVFPEVINHENLGSVIRICAAFGVDGIVLGPRSCDPLWRRAIRVSMGTVFHLPIHRSKDLHTDLQILQRDAACQLAAAVLDDQAEVLQTATRPARLALLFGNESQGLEHAYQKICDRRITIPMQLGTDSLNLAIAVAVFLYHFKQ